MVWLFFGLVISAAIGYAGYVKGALSRSGAAGAVVVGTIVFGLGGGIGGFCSLPFSSHLASSRIIGERTRRRWLINSPKGANAMPARSWRMAD